MPNASKDKMHATAAAIRGKTGEASRDAISAFLATARKLLRTGGR